MCGRIRLKSTESRTGEYQSQEHLRIIYPLAELNQRIFNFANGFVVFIVDVL